MEMPKIILSPNDQLANTVLKIDGAYSASTIRAYRADFIDFITYCSLHNQTALPVDPLILADYIVKLANGGRTSASIRRAITGIATIHKLNRFDDPSKDPDVTLEMRRMHRKLGRASEQAQGINQDVLEKMLDATDADNLGIRDRALLLVAYDTLCRRSELVSLQIQDIRVSIKNSIESTTILLRKSKTDQDSTGKWLHISQRAHLALKEWIGKIGAQEGQIFRGIGKSQKISSHLGGGQINRIFKRIARKAGLDESFVARISGHSMRVGHAQDLVISGASFPIIMSMGRWSKTDTVMRYVEHINYSH